MPPAGVIRLNEALERHSLCLSLRQSSREVSPTLWRVLGTPIERWLSPLVDTGRHVIAKNGRVLVCGSSCGGTGHVQVSIVSEGFDTYLIPPT